MKMKKPCLLKRLESSEVNSSLHQSVREDRQRVVETYLATRGAILLSATVTYVMQVQVTERPYIQVTTIGVTLTECRQQLQHHHTDL